METAEARFTAARLRIPGRIAPIGIEVETTVHDRHAIETNPIEVLCQVEFGDGDADLLV